MSEITVNIVAFDIPYPADYGGTIDIFYKLKALHAKGVSIILHCFKYNKTEQKELEKYCTEVIYYPRKKGLRYLLSRKPYIVATRNDWRLLRNLCTNRFPIIFEGLHSCYYLKHRKLQGRRKIVRAHNIEHDYYRGLHEASKSLFKRTFYRMEARKLERFEKVLTHATAILSINSDDTKYFEKNYCNTHYIRAFHPFDEIEAKPGKGEYFLYHGNLAVEENQKAVNFLLDEVFNTLDRKLIITGKNPGKDICARIAKLPNVEMLANPTNRQMYDLLKDAHACILPTFQDTGLKLKLLISLFSSRFVIANNLMVQHTTLSQLCEIAYTADEFKNAIKRIAEEEFTNEMLEQRREKLEQYTNQYNVKQLIKILENK